MVGSLVVGGRYTISGTGNGTAFVIDRQTGATWFCSIRCTRMHDGMNIMVVMTTKQRTVRITQKDFESVLWDSRKRSCPSSSF